MPSTKLNFAFNIAHFIINMAYFVILSSSVSLHASVMHYTHTDNKIEVGVTYICGMFHSLKKGFGLIFFITLESKCRMSF